MSKEPKRKTSKSAPDDLLSIVKAFITCFEEVDTELEKEKEARQHDNSRKYS